MIILQGITPEGLYLKIEGVIEKKINEKLTQKPKSSSYYRSRKEVAEHVKISLPTLHWWTKDGLLPSYKIGNRVLYKSKEVEEAQSKNRFSGIRL